MKSRSVRAWVTKERIDRDVLPRMQVLEALKVRVKICRCSGYRCREILVDI